MLGFQLMSNQDTIFSSIDYAKNRLQVPIANRSKSGMSSHPG